MIELPFGGSAQPAEHPSTWTIVPLAMADSSQESLSERDIVFRSLQAPYGSAPLHERIPADGRIAIIVSDKTRQCRTDLVLPILLNIVHECGVSADRVTIIFANGTHPPQTDDEIRAVLGSDIPGRYCIVENHAREQEHVLVGTTAAGTPVELHRTVAEADFVIAMGTIVHHYFAGYGGGAKLFMPGVASYRSAVTNHRRTLDSEGRFHPQCRDGVFQGNPVAEDIWDAVQFYPPSFYVGTVLNGSGAVAHAVAGDVYQAHTAGCRFVDAMYGVAVPRKADCVIVSPGGYPRDINMIQVHKSMHHASYALREGGVLICAAECRDGIGNPSFMKWFDYQDDAEMRAAVLRDYVMNAHTAITLRDKCRRFKVIFVSMLSPKDTERIGMQHAVSLQQAVDMAAGILPSDAFVYTIRSGFTLVPMVQESSSC